MNIINPQKSAIVSIKYLFLLIRVVGRIITCHLQQFSNTGSGPTGGSLEAVLPHGGNS